MNAAMADVNVLLCGTARVSLSTAVLTSLDETPVLRDEITHEAVRIALTERMGQFDRMKIRHNTHQWHVPDPRATTKETPKFVAEISFDGLCDSIQRLQQEYDRVMDLCTAMHLLIPEKVDATDVTGGPVADDHLSDGSAERLSALRELLDAVLTPPDTHNDGSPCDPCNDAEVARDSDDEAHERAGYRPLLGDGSRSPTDSETDHFPYQRFDD
jgi:hypothetical protein